MKTPGEFSLSPGLVKEARVAARQSGRPLVEVMEEKSGLTPEGLVAELARIWRYKSLPMAELRDQIPDFQVIPYAEATRRECIALRDDAGSLRLVVADPFDAGMLEWAEARMTEPFTWTLAHRKDIAAYLALHEETMRAMDGLLPDRQRNEVLTSGTEDLSLLSISEDTSPVVRLVHSTLYDALKTGVSDIHLETDVDQLIIKYRMDGVLMTVGTVSGTALAEQIVSRIKVMSDLDIAERRVPQDGRFKVSMRGREVDFRVSVMPSIFGEDVVLRVEGSSPPITTNK